MVDRAESGTPGPGEADPAASQEADPAAEEDPGAADAGTLAGRVEERYDFDHFTPADMAEMTVEEWEAAFDADTWITGTALLDRVEAELRSRVARRDLFAVVERETVDGADRVLAYTDAGYALVGPDGSVEGEGSILLDVEPVVALCSMEAFEVGEPPADAGLPDPATVDESTGSLGDRLVLGLAAVQILAGVGLLLAPVLLDLTPDGSGRGGGLLAVVAGLGFLFIGIVLAVVVANARLSGRFRAAEYRERLRAAGVGSDERPPFLPGEGPDAEGAGGTGGESTEGAGESTPE